MNGVIFLHRNLLCKTEVLGKVFFANIAGVNVKIHFPYIDDKGKSEDTKNNDFYSLVPPIFAKSWRRNNKPIEWGRISKKAKEEAFVSCLACSVDCLPDEENRVAESLFEVFAEWEEKLLSYCVLAGMNVSKQNMNDRKISPPIVLEGRYGILASAGAYFTEIRFCEDNEFLSIHQVEKAIKFASSDKEFFIEYQLLLAASESKKNGRNKYAIFDSCAAIEMCLDNVIDRVERNRGSNEQPLGRHRYLKEKFEVVKSIDPSFPDIDCGRIVEMRNDIAHNRKRVFSDAETKEVIYLAEICLRHFLPEFC